MMLKEAVKEHNFKEEDVKVVGAPHCDFCYDDRYNETKEEFFKNLNLDSRKKLLTVATAPYKAVGDHTYILDILLTAIESKSFEYPVQILCRLHPNDIFDRYKKYENNNHITFHIPNKNYDLSGWKTDEIGLKCLTSTLKYSDVLINIASTVTIEACFFDTPVINMAFSTSEQERFKERILVAHHQRHYKYLLNLNGVKLAHNEKEFIEDINEYLRNPEVDRNGRMRIKEEILNNPDGKSSERVADCVLSLI
jgi:CDP-glycerol glycerophosphotransferase (TagB/SpsB family)